MHWVKLMQNEPINTFPIQNFFKVVKSADASRANEVRLDINQAKQLSFVLGQVLARLNGNLESLLIKKQSASQTEEVININLDGGKDW